MGAGAEAALIIGVKSDPGGGEARCRERESLRVVVQAVQGEDDDRWLALGQPTAQRQAVAVIAD